MSWNNSRDSVRTLVFSVAVLALTVAGLIFTSTLSGSTAEASVKGSQPVSPAATFNADAGSLGAIPDGTSGCSTAGSPRNVTFNVSGLSGAPTSVSLNITATHSWVGDVNVVLTAPDSTAFTVFGRTGLTSSATCGDSSNLGGAYNFTDAATGTNWWADAATGGTTVSVTPGDYRTTEAGPQPVGNFSPVTNLSAAFAGVSNPNGTWTMTVTDSGAGDTGSITGASITIEAGGGGTVTAPVNYDVNGDGRTDYGVVRGGGALAAKGASVNRDLVAFGGDKRMTQRQLLAARKQMSSANLGETDDITWYSATTDNNTIGVTNFGHSFTDTITPADFDGDGSSDIAVWRPAAEGSAFYILQSSDATVRTEVFGQEGDDPTVVGDYDGDGMADPAVYRCPPFDGDPGTCYFFYRGSNNNPSGGVTFVPWGYGVDFDFFTAPGDYDGDGKQDFCIQRADPSNPANAQFILLRSSDSNVEYINWGVSTDVIVPGDYDGDGMSDLCVRRTVSGTRQHWVLFRNGTYTFFVWGIDGDQSAPGDYDGDGKTDFAIRRPSTGDFWVYNSSNGGAAVYPFGLPSDQVTAGWQVK